MSQRTETGDFNKLIVTTIQALAGFEDVVIAARLCHKGASLASEHGVVDQGHSNFGQMPQWCITFPYDAVLQHPDILILASGYASWTHVGVNSVSLIQAGLPLDKADIGRWVDYSGLGVYLYKSAVSPQDVSGAVDRIA